VTYEAARQAAAAQALATYLPASGPLECILRPSADGVVDTAGLTLLTGGYLGDASAELALGLPPATAGLVRQAGGSTAVPLGDILRPGLEAAAACLGAGVLGQVAQVDPPALFADPATAVYRLSEPGSSEPFAWFALRSRTRGGPARATGQLSSRKLGRIHDVEMALSVVIGRTRMTVAELLSLEPGDVVDLDRPAGAPADVLLNGRLIAHGEVVVVDQEYGVRVTKILDSAETVD